MNEFVNSEWDCYEPDAKSARNASGRERGKIMKKALQRCHNLEDIRRLARSRAHRMVFDYIDGGADDEVALANNRSRFSAYEMIYNVLAGVDEVDLSTTILGQTVAAPFILSPSAGNRLFHKDGERAVAIAADRAGVVYCLSTLSTVSIEEIGTLTRGPKWFQLYAWKDRVLIKEMISRAKAAGFKALVLTADMPITGNRERDLHNGLTIPPRIGLKQVYHALRAPGWTWDYLTSAPITYANLSKTTPAVSLADFVSQQLHAGFSWKDAEWLLGEWVGPSALKGVIGPDDAARAVKTGFNAISISNHGGRQLDASPAPIDMLVPIRDRIGEAAELIVDGGIRRASDILKAVALGAQCASFARPYLFGLAAGGQLGVERALDHFSDALRRDMLLLGAANVDALKRDIIVRRA